MQLMREKNQMIDNLISILTTEEVELQKLLVLLENQHKLIVNKEVFKLEAIVDEIKLANKSVAQAEVARRKLVNGKTMKSVITETGNKDLDQAYRRIKRTLKSIEIQNETNDMLLKQQLIYTNKLLNIINPKRDVKTYNSYGKI